jgi:hypothetical protein
MDEELPKGTALSLLITKEDRIKDIGKQGRTGMRQSMRAHPSHIHAGTSAEFLTQLLAKAATALAARTNECPTLQ